jgi:hypothetical protein
VIRLSRLRSWWPDRGVPPWNAPPSSIARPVDVDRARRRASTLAPAAAVVVSTALAAYGLVELVRGAAR